MAQINKHAYGNINRSNTNLMLKYNAELVGISMGKKPKPLAMIAVLPCKKP